MTPDCCPICKARIPPIASLGMQGIACSQCQTSLWILRHRDDTYFYDTNDMGLFREHQTRFRIERQNEFAENGWVEIEDETELFSQLTAKRRFSLQRPHLIEVVGDAVGLNFSDVEICYPSPSIEQQEIENNLRQLTMESFLECSPESDCFVMDVNHSAYRFLPACVTSTALKTWPIPMHSVSRLEFVHDGGDYAELDTGETARTSMHGRLCVHIRKSSRQAKFSQSSGGCRPNRGITIDDAHGIAANRPAISACKSIAFVTDDRWTLCRVQRSCMLATICLNFKGSLNA